MLSEAELEQLFEKFNIPVLGRNLIRGIRKNAPVRRVHGGGISQTIRYCGRKMNFVIEAEAIRTEFATIVSFDHDDDILEFYHQPCRLNIAWRKSDGRKSAAKITPDLFCISRSSGFYFVECKHDDHLSELGQKDPVRFTIRDDGKWHSAPAEAAASEFGCDFVIRPASESNWILIENLEFLKDYYIHPFESDEHESQKLREFFSKNPWGSVHDLISNIKADVVYNVIVKREYFFDLNGCRLKEVEAAYLFRDEISAQAYKIYLESKTNSPSLPAGVDLRPGCVFLWDGRRWEVVNIGDRGVAARCVDSQEPMLMDLTYQEMAGLAKGGKIIAVGEHATVDSYDLLRKCSPKDIQVAVWRHEILFGIPGKDNPYVNKSTRTRFYWMAGWREAEAQHGYGFVGLVPNWEKTQGNHERKIEEGVIAIIKELYPEHWVNPKQKSITQFWGAVNNLCEERGFATISVKTLRGEIRKIQTAEDVRAREGRKRAYQSEIQYWHIHYETPIHGTHPFHIAHIDHSPFDVRLINSKLNAVVKTATLTLMIDAFSRKVLAWYLSFDKPSHRSCMMVLRDCVRRHGRLPQRIVSDGGAEFQSVYYEKVLAVYYVDKQSRKTGKPRDGGVIERMFRLTREQFANALLGNTQAEQYFRQVSPEVNPIKLAIWTLERLTARLEEYFEIYHRNFHSTLGCTPNQKSVEGARVYGERKNVLINYDKNFIVATMPTTKKMEVKVTSRGVKVNYIYYTSQELNNYSKVGSKLPVRYDPMDAGHAYVYCNNEWVECFSEYYKIFKGMSVRMLNIATQCLRQKFKMAGKEYEITAQRLATFVSSVEEEEKLVMQDMHDTEVQSVNARISQDLLVSNEGEDREDVSGKGCPDWKPTILDTF